MKKFLIVLVSFFVFANAHAQSKKIMLPMTCESVEFVEKVLNQYKEEQLFVGQDNSHNIPDLNVMLFLNKNTGTYSLLILVSSVNMLCVVSSGEKGKMLYND